MTAPRGGGSSRAPGASSGARGAVVVGLAVVLGIVGLQIVDDSGPSTSVATVTTAAPGATPGGATTTTPLRPNSAVRVKVYNSSGVQGRAQTLTDSLRAKGYNMQAPATLTSRRAGTVVECTDAFSREGALLTLYGVGNGAQVAAYPSNPPAGASEADCLVIIGTE